MEIGKIGKKILSKAIEKLKVRTGLKLWKNTESVLSWFNRLENKQDLKFIGFDIKDYYTSISEDLFKEALEWASSMVEFSDEEIEVIMESKRTLLYDGHHLWKKKGAGDFLIAMGSWDGAESTDIVGLFLLDKLRGLNVDVGLYRDDGLLVSRLTARETEMMKKKLFWYFSFLGSI